MLLPLIPLLCGGFVAGGLAGLWWYSSLSKEQQVEADRKANELAWRLYQTSIDNLTRAQLDVVSGLVKQHFTS